jgi:hypothetical protein
MVDALSSIPDRWKKKLGSLHPEQKFLLRHKCNSSAGFPLSAEKVVLGVCKSFSHEKPLAKWWEQRK